MPDQDSSNNATRRVIDAVVFLCRALAFSAEAFMHRRFGPRYIGTQAVAVLPIVLIYALCWPGSDRTALIIFVIAYLVMCASALIGVWYRKRRCVQLPDGYSGCPKSLKTFRFLGEEWIKRIVEPLYVAVLAWAMTVFDKPLSVYLMIVSVALLLTVNAPWITARVRRAKFDPSKPRPLLVQVRRVTRAQAEQFYKPATDSNEGGRS